MSKKSSFSAFALSLVTLAGLSSCEMVEPSGPASERGPMSISVSTEWDNALKSNLYNKNRAMFEAGDIISVFDGTTNNEFTTKEGGISAVFTGEAIKDLGKYWFLFPYQSTATLSKDNNLITTNVPTSQTAVAESFDPKALLSVGIGTEKAAVLKNVCCLLKFTINDGADVKKITLKGDASLSGDIVVSASDATVINAVKTANEIVMTGDFVDGTTYYLAALPGTHSAIELSAEDSNGQVTSKATGTFTFERSKIHDLGYIGAVSQIKGNPLCFTAEKENSTVSLDVVGSANWMFLDYSTDGASWANYTMGTLVKLPNSGDKVYFRNRYTFADVKVKSSSSNYYKFKLSGQVAASGNIISLLCRNMEANEAPSYSFYKLFMDCPALTSAPEIPVTILGSYCCSYMFSGCTNLSSAPKLPATNLGTYCYDNMFRGCLNLSSAPKLLPATNLSNYCYKSMFLDCTTLTEAPELPAQNLADRCYLHMFNGCTSLVDAPALPATKLSQQCYANMFEGCTSLVTSPALPAMTLATECYYGMFKGCINLESAPVLPATQNASSCYGGMFENCKKIDYLEVALTSTSYGSCNNFLSGTAAYGTVVCPSTFHAAGIVNDDSNIPDGWTVINSDLGGTGVHNERYSEGTAPVWN